MAQAAEQQTSFLLNDPDLVWQVEQGHVDLFGTVQADGVAQAGPWHHLHRFGPGEQIWGVPTGVPTGVPGEQQDQTLLMCQLLPGAGLRRLSRFDVLAAAEFGVTPPGWQRWLAALSEALAPKTMSDLRRDLAITLGPEGLVEYDTGAVLAPAAILWLQIEKGSLQWCGQPGLLIERADLIAVAPPVWLEVSDSARFTTYSTGDLAAEPALFGEAIDRTHRFLLRAAAVRVAEAEATMVRQLQARQRHDAALLADAVEELANTVPGQAASAAARRLGGIGAAGAPPSSGLGAEVGWQNPLFAMCRIVGKSQGIEMKLPRAATGGQLGADPISEIAMASGAQVRPVRLRGQWWRRDNGPLLGFINNEEGLEPVALLPASPSRYDLIRSNGRQESVTPKLAQGFHEQAFMFYPTLPARKVSGFDLLRLGRRVVWARDVVTIILVGLLVGGLGMLTPIVTGDLFDRVIPQANTSYIWPLGVLLVASAVGSLLLQFAQSLALQRVEGRLEATTQSAVWDRVANLPATFFREYTAGDLAMRAMGINAIRQMLSGVALTTILSSVFSVFNLGLLFYYDRRLAAIALFILALTMASTLILGYISVRLQRQLAEIYGRISGLVLQLINGVNKFRMAGAEARAFRLWANEFSRQRQITFKARTVQNIQATINTMLPLITNLILFNAFVSKSGGGTGPLGGITTGYFLAFLAAFGAVNGALMGLSSTLLSLLSVVPLYERARPILVAAPEVDQERIDPGTLTGEIELSQVTFRYKDDGPLVVDGASMHIRPGQFVAVVGPSGQGKSTLLRLLLGFEQPEAGSIYFDGKDLATLDLRSVRRQMGVVLQNATLTQGDIYSNIVGAANISIEEAWQAANMAGLAADIEQMPMGMHTMIPDGGGTLSGGQRQRLLIARALVRRPRILLFDEATSALDNVTQATVMDSLAGLRATRVVIAHRLSTVMQADWIVVFNHGRVAEQGTYEELMAKEGMFAELAQRQLA